MVGLTLEAGRPWPMGAHADAQGINFAVFSAHASKVELCLFDPTGAHETARLPLPGHHVDVWHGYLRGAQPGLLYGLRVHGPWRPERGHRFNPHKLLIDPYARDIAGRFTWNAEHFGQDLLHPQHQDMRDNAATALKSRVVADTYDWGDDRPLHTPLADSVIYELHVKGFTQLHPDVPGALRGTYAGLAHPTAVAHLQRLGVTAVELLPVHRHLDERHLVRRDLSNYWGYNTLGFFCAEPGYASGANARDEFRDMVRALHAAGIEVILDVVYNHTCESDEHGPTLSWRGLDNSSWYRLPPDAPGRYENHSGCGNTLDLRHPRVLQFVMDSLRYWVQHMHVDGFRFDLATVLGRDDVHFSQRAALFKAIAQDPVLCGVKLIAEPWDLGPDGYQLGNFPRGWLEWNDRFRDSMRGWWLQQRGTRGEFAQRLCASADTFHHRHRAPAESVNYIVSHDGFTLRDLVSHDHRHNEANGENGADGHAHNLSWNCGVEGETDNPDVLVLRARLVRALLATTLLSQGTPMLAAGDELGHTQRGNNNPYCQDNALTWIDWKQADYPLIAFTQRLLRLRRDWHPLDDRWFTGLPDVRGVADLAWLTPAGEALEGDAWNHTNQRCLGAWLGAPGPRGAPPLQRSEPSPQPAPLPAPAADAPPQPQAAPDSIAPPQLLLLFNAGAADQPFTLPSGRWQPWLDSSTPGGAPRDNAPIEQQTTVPARAVMLLTQVTWTMPPLPATPTP